MALHKDPTPLTARFFRSSIQDELQQLPPGQNHQGGGGPVIKIPSPGDADSANFYFAPISPAAKTGSGNGQEDKQPQEAEGGSVLMDLIRKGDHGEFFALFVYPTLGL